MSGDGDFVDIPMVSGSIYTGESEANALVSDQIDKVNSYADQAYKLMEDYLRELENVLNGLEIPSTASINIETPSFGSVDFSARPTLAGANIDTANWPANSATPPTAIAVPSFSGVTIPTFSIVDPSWTTVDEPVNAVITDPGDMPALADVSVPTAPVVTLPSAPTLDAITIPAVPSMTIPEFEATFTSDTLDNPSPFVWGDPAYLADDSGQIWSALLAKVLNDITNGGTGLSAAVEAELYQRHLDRTADENAKLLDSANNYWAARGWTIPPGMLAGQIAEAMQQISRNNLNASRDITISQAELAQKNTQFVMEQGAKLEGMMRDFFTQNTNRVFEAAKFSAQNAVEIFNAMVALHNSKVEAYRTEAAIYESKIKGALAAVELFKGQIEGAKVSSELQKNLVAVYEAQIGAAESQMKLFVSEMEGAKIAMELSTAQLEGYRLKVQAYIARLDGEKAKIGIYEAKLGAEESKAKVYTSQIQAYVAQVQAVESVANIEIKRIEAVIQQNASEIERYKAELSGFEAEVRAKAATVQAQTDGFKAEASTFEAMSRADASYYAVVIEDIKAKIEAARFNMEKAKAEVEATIQAYTSIKGLQVEGTKGIMNVGAQLTASALNAVNTSASYGYSGSRSYSQGLSEGISYNASLSESHSYDETPTA